MKPEEAIALYLEHNRRKHVSGQRLRGIRTRLSRFRRFCRMSKITKVRKVKLLDLLVFYHWLVNLKKPDGTLLSTQYINAQAHQVMTLFEFLADNIFTVDKDVPLQKKSGKK